MVFKLQAGAFYGTTARAVNLSGFSLTEKSYAPQSNRPRHAHELAHFCFVVSGNYTEEFGGRGEERTPTTLIFYPSDMADAVGVHPVHMARVFRKFQRCTVGEHVRQLRVAYACQRMLSSDEPLVEIALSAGFADHTLLTLLQARDRDDAHRVSPGRWPPL